MTLTLETCGLMNLNLNQMIQAKANPGRICEVPKNRELEEKNK